MDETPTYEELLEAGGASFDVWGPNSGGAEGVVVQGGRVWRFAIEMGQRTPDIRPASWSYAEYIARHQDSENRGHRAAIAHIQSLTPES